MNTKGEIYQNVQAALFSTMLLIKWDFLIRITFMENSKTR